MSSYRRNILGRRFILLSLLAAGALIIAACQPIVDTRQSDTAAAPTATAAEEAVEDTTDTETADIDAAEPEADETEADEEEADESEAAEEVAGDDATAGEPAEEPAEEPTAELEAEPVVEAEILVEPATATITTRSLRVRAAPNEDSDVVAGAREGESYPVIAISADGGWVQIEIDRAEDGVGWVTANFISIEGDITEAATAPVASPSAESDDPASAFDLGAAIATVDTRSLIVRAEPDDDSEVVAGINQGDAFVVTGISSDGVWLQLEIDTAPDNSGWVQAHFVRLTGDLTSIVTIGEIEEDEPDEIAAEDTGEDTETPATVTVPVDSDFSTATVSTRSLFVRAEPNADSDPVAGAREGESYPVLGISEDGAWVLIETARSETGEGWVSAEFVTLE